MITPTMSLVKPQTFKVMIKSHIHTSEFNEIQIILCPIINAIITYKLPILYYNYVIHFILISAMADVSRNKNKINTAPFLCCLRKENKIKLSSRDGFDRRPRTPVGQRTKQIRARRKRRGNKKKKE